MNNKLQKLIDGWSSLLTAKVFLMRSSGASGLSKRSRDDEAIARLLCWDPEQVEQASAADIRQALKQWLKSRRGGSAFHDISIHGCSLEKIVHQFGLSEVESRILVLSLLIHGNSLLKDASRCLRVMSKAELNWAVAELISQPVDDVRVALSATGRLRSTGLLERGHPYRMGADSLDEFLEPASGLTVDLLTQEEDVSEILQRFCRPACPSQLTLQDYDHYASEVDLISRLLTGACRARQKGVNVLLYGPPGTGKTELARALVASTSLHGAEAITVDEDGDPLGARERLSKFLVSQKLLSTIERGVMIFDEVEELLGPQEDEFGIFGKGRKKAASDKAWKTKILEENPAPAIWVGNVIEGIDDALLRRFSFSLKVDVPPRSKRLTLLNRAFSNLGLSEKVLDRMADHGALTPADVDRTRRVIDLACPSADRDLTGEVAMVISGRPGGISRSHVEKAEQVPALPYRVDWINATPDIKGVAPILKHRGFGRLGLFGEPGTGKTAYVRHIAAELNVPYLAKSASDWLNPFVGQTEQMIADSFREAANDGALLFIDEADSFLQSRHSAQSSWQVTQVNELLNQIERHEGFVVLASNYRDRLDPALARRLDLKVELKMMRREQALDALVEAAALLGCPRKEANQLMAQYLEDFVGEITLGDIACAIRQSMLRALNPDASLLWECVQAEVVGRIRGHSRPIGFRAGGN